MAEPLGIFEQSLIEALTRLLLTPTRNLHIPSQFNPGGYEQISFGGELMEIVVRLMKTQEFQDLLKKVETSVIKSLPDYQTQITEQVTQEIKAKVENVVKNNIDDYYRNSLINRLMNEVFSEQVAIALRENESLKQKVAQTVDLNNFEIKITANVTVINKPQGELT